MRIPAGALSGGRLQGDGAWNADSRAHAQVADPTARDATPAQNAHAAGPLELAPRTSTHTSTPETIAEAGPGPAEPAPAEPAPAATAREAELAGVRGALADKETELAEKQQTLTTREAERAALEGTRTTKAEPVPAEPAPAEPSLAVGVGGSTSDSPDVRGHTGSVPPSGAGISAVVATEGHGYRSSDPTWKVFGYEVPREERQDWCELNKELLDGQREEPRNIRSDANILRGWVTDAGQLKKQPRVVRFLVSSTFTVCSGTLKNPQMNPQNPHEKERKSLVRHELGFRTTSTICARHTRFGRSFI